MIGGDRIEIEKKSGGFSFGDQILDAAHIHFGKFTDLREGCPQQGVRYLV